MELNIIKDYTPHTGLRYCTISENSGEDFYHKKLNPLFKQALENKEHLILYFENLPEEGFSPSFVDEAIGNLVYDFTADIVTKYLEAKSTIAPHVIYQIEYSTIPNWEKRRKEGIAPKKTIEHEAWYRIINGKIESKVWIHSSND